MWKLCSETKTSKKLIDTKPLHVCIQSLVETICWVTYNLWAEHIP